MELALPQLPALGVSWLIDESFQTVCPAHGLSSVARPPPPVSFLLAGLGTHVNFSSVGFDGTIPKI